MNSNDEVTSEPFLRVAKLAKSVGRSEIHRKPWRLSLAPRKSTDSIIFFALMSLSGAGWRSPGKNGSVSPAKNSPFAKCD